MSKQGCKENAAPAEKKTAAAASNAAPSYIDRARFPCGEAWCADRRRLMVREKDCFLAENKVDSHQHISQGGTFHGK